MKVGKFVLGPVATNCYIGINEKTNECFYRGSCNMSPGVCKLY